MFTWLELNLPPPLYRTTLQTPEPHWPGQTRFLFDGEHCTWSASVLVLYFLSSEPHLTALNRVGLLLIWACLHGECHMLCAVGMLTTLSYQVPSKRWAAESKDLCSFCLAMWSPCLCGTGLIQGLDRCWNEWLGKWGKSRICILSGRRTSALLPFVHALDTKEYFSFILNALAIARLKDI